MQDEDENKPRYGIYLEDGKGKRVGGYRQSSSWDGNTFTADMHFQGVAQKGWSLVFVTPRRTVLKEYPFTLKGLPVP